MLLLGATEAADELDRDDDFPRGAAVVNDSDDPVVECKVDAVEDAEYAVSCAAKDDAGDGDGLDDDKCEDDELDDELDDDGLEDDELKDDRIDACEWNDGEHDVGWLYDGDGDDDGDDDEDDDGQDVEKRADERCEDGDGTFSEDRRGGNVMPDGELDREEHDDDETNGDEPGNGGRDDGVQNGDSRDEDDEDDACADDSDGLDDVG